MSLAQRGLAFGGAGSFTDPGRDRWQASVDYGDGKGPQPLPLKGDKTFELSHVYMQTGNFTVTVRVEDEDGGVGTASFPVKVKDYLFILEGGADTSINEGSALVRSVPVRGPAKKVQSITVDYGDGSAVGTLALDLVNRSGPQKMGEAVVPVQDIPSADLRILPVIGQINLKYLCGQRQVCRNVKLTDTDGDVYEAGFQAEGQCGSGGQHQERHGLQDNGVFHLFRRLYRPRFRHLDGWY